jgi:DMSO/TMAO reductase YedYZ molybdopterin-dependent catalytic subunit
MTTNRRIAGRGALLGGLTSLAVIGLSYLGERLARLPFIPLDVFDWLARVLPGAVINLTIDTMVRIITAAKIGPTWAVAKMAEQFMGMSLFVLAGIVFGGALTLLGRRRPERIPLMGMAGGLILLAIALAAEVAVGFPPAGPLQSGLWLAVLFLSWGAVLSAAVRAAVRPGEPGPDPARRHFLWLVGLGSFTVAVSALGAKVLSRNEGPRDPGRPQSADGGLLESDQTSGPAASPSWKELEARTEPAPGTRAELTPLKDFYRIDINTRPPKLDGSAWRLDIRGLVERPLSLSLAEVRSRRAVHQAATLSCISNPIGGDLISTGVWTGVRLKDILAAAGLLPGARAIAIKSADGFYESVGLAEAMDDRTLLVHSMNGEPLTAAHGFPLRIFIPGHYGMKQPKWITSLEAVDREGPGYWVDRGWDKTAGPNTTSVIDAVAARHPDNRTGLVPVGGIAYAGQRGISKVEVQVDGGPWTAAELRTPPLGPLTWVQWRFDWPAAAGHHVLKVRAYDGRGVLQEIGEKGTFPAGATGIHEMAANIKPAGPDTEGIPGGTRPSSL